MCVREVLVSGGNMAVTLYRQVGKGKARRYQKVNLGRGRRPADLTGPYFLRYSLADGTRPWETNSSRQSTPRSASRHISKLWMPMSRSFRTKTKPVGRQSRTPCISASLSFTFFSQKNNRTRGKSHYERTTSASGFF